MYLKFSLVVILSTALTAFSQEPRGGPAVRAIVPTASGQIGI
jgi:hypothetical protein